VADDQNGCNEREQGMIEWEVDFIRGLGLGFEVLLPDDSEMIEGQFALVLDIFFVRVFIEFIDDSI